MISPKGERGWPFWPDLKVRRFPRLRAGPALLRRVPYTLRQTPPQKREAPCGRSGFASSGWLAFGAPQLVRAGVGLIAAPHPASHLGVKFLACDRLRRGPTGG